MLVQRLNSQLEDQGISLRLTSHPHPVRQGNPTISYTTAGIALGILEVCKPNHPVQSTFVKVEIPSSQKNLERWTIYRHELKRSKNGRMEQSKAMEHESRKASSDVLKQRKIYIYIYINRNVRISKAVELTPSVLSWDSADVVVSF